MWYCVETSFFSLQIFGYIFLIVTLNIYSQPVYLIIVFTPIIVCLVDLSIMYNIDAIPTLSNGMFLSSRKDPRCTYPLLHGNVCVHRPHCVVQKTILPKGSFSKYIYINKHLPSFCQTKNRTYLQPIC